MQSEPSRHLVHPACIDEYIRLDGDNKYERWTSVTSISNLTR